MVGSGGAQYHAPLVHGHEHRGEHGHVPPDPNEGVVRAEPPQRQALTVATAVGIVTLLVLVAVALAASGG